MNPMTPPLPFDDECLVPLDADELAALASGAEITPDNIAFCWASRVTRPIVAGLMWRRLLANGTIPEDHPQHARAVRAAKAAAGVKEPKWRIATRRENARLAKLRARDRIGGSIGPRVAVWALLEYDQEAAARKERYNNLQRIKMRVRRAKLLENKAKTNTAATTTKTTAAKQKT